MVPASSDDLVSKETTSRRSTTVHGGVLETLSKADVVRHEFQVIGTDVVVFLAEEIIFDFQSSVTPGNKQKVHGVNRAQGYATLSMTHALTSSISSTVQ